MPVNATLEPERIGRVDPQQHFRIETKTVTLETTINRRVQALEVVAVPAERTYDNVVSHLVDLLSFVLICVPLFSFAGPSDNTDSRLFP